MEGGGAGEKESPAELKQYDEGMAPRPFGFDNPGSLCYFNSLLQGLLGCTAFVEAAGGGRGLEGTRTGRELARLVRAAREAERGARLTAAPLFGALLEDLREKKPKALGAFGPGQQSATEAFVFLLEMAESGGGEAPLTQLFSHRYRCTVTCLGCRAKTAQEDSAVTIYLGHLDGLESPPRTAEEFVGGLLRQGSVVEGYACEACGKEGKALRLYNLTLVPEILVCHFDLYTRGPKERFFPRELGFPKRGGGSLAYRLVGQVEHAGGLEGGHYTARGLRAGGEEFGFNDGAVRPAELRPTAGTYLAVYHATASPGS